MRTALEMVRPRPDDRLLDVGTGTGALLRELASHPSRPREAVGVDICPEMLARIPPLPSGWRVLEADARHLPFSDASFDAVTAAYLLHLLSAETLGRVLAEIRRVLVPAGRLVAVTIAASGSGLAAPVRGMLNGLARLAPDWLGGLRVIDTRAALAREGFLLRAERHVWRGYPSLCALAQPAASA